MAQVEKRMEKRARLNRFSTSIMMSVLLLAVFSLVAFFQADFSFDEFKEPWFWALNLSAVGATFMLKNSTTEGSSLRDEDNSEQFQDNLKAIKNAKSATSKAALTRELTDHCDTHNEMAAIEQLIYHLDYCVDNGKAYTVDYSLNQYSWIGRIWYRWFGRKPVLSMESQDELLADKVIFNSILVKKKKGIELTTIEEQKLLDYNKTISNIYVDKINPSMLFNGIKLTNGSVSLSFDRNKEIINQNKLGTFIGIAMFIILSSLSFGEKEITLSALLPYIIKLISVFFGGVMGIMAGHKVFEIAHSKQEGRLHILSQFLDRFKSRVDAAMSGKEFLVQEPKSEEKKVEKVEPAA